MTWASTQVDTRRGQHDGLIHLAYSVMSPSYDAPALCQARCIGWTVLSHELPTCLRCIMWWLQP